MPQPRRRPMWSATVDPETPDRIERIQALNPLIRSKGAAVDVAILEYLRALEREAAKRARRAD